MKLACCITVIRALIMWNVHITGWRYFEVCFIASSVYEIYFLPSIYLFIYRLIHQMPKYSELSVSTALHTLDKFCFINSVWYDFCIIVCSVFCKLVLHVDVTGQTCPCCVFGCVFCNDADDRLCVLSSHSSVGVAVHFDHSHYWWWQSIGAFEVMSSRHV